MTERIQDYDVSLDKALDELMDGDIIVFQKYVSLTISISFVCLSNVFLISAVQQTFVLCSELQWSVLILDSS